MRKFLVSSTKYNGEIEILFNEHDHLVRIDFMNAALNEGQIRNVLQIAPTHFAQLEKAFANTSAIIVESTFEITFEMFWDKYNMKRNKIPAQKLWNNAKFSAVDKAKAFHAIDAYDKYLKRNDWLNKMYPDTFLRNRHFEDEWNKLK